MAPGNFFLTQQGQINHMSEVRTKEGYTHNHVANQTKEIYSQKDI